MNQIIKIEWNLKEFFRVACLMLIQYNRYTFSDQKRKNIMTGKTSFVGDFRFPLK